MGRPGSFRSKAAHFVSDLTTVFLNPISDNTSKPPNTFEIVNEATRSNVESVIENDPKDSVDGPDTSSLRAFIYSLLSTSEAETNTPRPNDRQNDQPELGELSSEGVMESGGKKSLFSKGKQSLGRAFYQAARISGVLTEGVVRIHNMKIDENNNSTIVEEELKVINCSSQNMPCVDLPNFSEPSLLLSENMQRVVNASLPALVQGCKWVLIYSTWRHGISLSTLYRRSILWPGLSLLVVGDCKGAVFGGLLEAPLSPTNKKYQGTNNTFVFTNNAGRPIIYHPTGVNRYFTLCSADFLALGGGGHFALYIEADMLNGSSSVSETYGNPCLARTEDFQVKEVELWGFVHTSKYEEVVTLLRTEVPGICRW